MEKELARSQMVESSESTKPDRVSDSGLQRRKILGWMGIGVFGALAVNMLPFKSVAGKVLRRRKSNSPVKAVALNDMAVKRNRKAR